MYIMRKGLNRFLGHLLCLIIVIIDINELDDCILHLNFVNCGYFFYKVIDSNWFYVSGRVVGLSR